MFDCPTWKLVIDSTFNFTYFAIIPLMCSLSPSHLKVVATSFNLSFVQNVNMSTFTYCQNSNLSAFTACQPSTVHFTISENVIILTCWFVRYRKNVKLKAVEQLNHLQLKSMAASTFQLSTFQLLNCFSCSMLKMGICFNIPPGPRQDTQGYY